MTFQTEMITVVVTAIGALLSGLISVFIAYLYAVVKQKFGENAALKSSIYLNMIEEHVQNAVVAAQESIVKDLKADNGGKLTEEKALEIKSHVVQSVLVSLGGLKDDAEAQLRIDIPEYVNNLVEVVLKDVKEFDTK